MLLASARTISVLGNGFARVALSFAVLALPGAGPGQLSLVLACQAVPQLLFVLAGGVIADRMSRSRLMIVTDLVGAAAYAALAAMVLTGHAPYWRSAHWRRWRVRPPRCSPPRWTASSRCSSPPHGSNRRTGCCGSV